MVINGTGGANTKTGALFEIKTDVKTNLINGGIDISKIEFLQQHAFAAYMKKYGFNMKEHFGKDFRPDEAFIYNNHLYIIEKKFQCGGGSTDEKIQSGPYKKLIYDICAEHLKLNGATFIYLLSDFFNTPKFTTHQIPYLIEQGIPVYFNNFPLDLYFN